MMMEELKNKLWLVLIVAIISTAAVIIVGLIVFSGPIAERIAGASIRSQDAGGIHIPFEGSFESVDGQEGSVRGVTIVGGQIG